MWDAEDEDGDAMKRAEIQRMYLVDIAHEITPNYLSQGLDWLRLRQ